MDGIILINKPKDWTSRDVCNKISHILNTKKVGHSGTLDPFATGLLIVAIGNATKCLPYCDNSIKTYEASLLLGKKTSTGDYQGETIKEKEIKKHSEDEIINVFESFLGDQNQIPPMTSAIHVNGQKLYKLAHKGIEIQRKARQIHIFSLNLLSFKDNIINFKCTVSSGTYIRTLGEDIANKLGEVGHLISLNRTNIGSHSLSEAVNIDADIKNHISDSSSFISLPSISVDEQIKTDLLNGKRIKLVNCSIKKVLILDENKKSIAICENEKDDIFKIVRGLW